MSRRDLFSRCAIMSRWILNKVSSALPRDLKMLCSGSHVLVSNCTRADCKPNIHWDAIIIEGHANSYERSL